MTTLTRTLFITALSAPLAASAQDAPTGTSPQDRPTGTSPQDAPTGTSPMDTGDTPKASETDTAKKDTAKKEKLAENELQIIAYYYKDNLMEIELATLAKQRAASKEVKSYGEMVLNDHRAFNKKLTDLTKKTGQKIPEVKPTSDAEKKALADAKKSAADIKKLSGASFDREYLSFMAESHHHASVNIDTHITVVKHTELVSLLRDVKPTLQQHEARARELQQSEGQAMK
jgi:putative membrane protein